GRLGEDEEAGAEEADPEGERRRPAAQEDRGEPRGQHEGQHDRYDAGRAWRHDEDRDDPRRRGSWAHAELEARARRATGRDGYGDVGLAVRPEPGQRRA